jgi:archaellum component FlaC
MFTGVSAQFVDDNALLAKGTDGDMTPVEGLKNEVQALKSRCDILEKTVNNLKSICDTHQGIIETFRQQIVNLHGHQGTLDLSYQGEEFESMP